MFNNRFSSNATIQTTYEAIGRIGCGAAAGVAVTPAMGQMLGQNLFPSNNPWNQDISGAPVAANSATIISGIGGSVKIHPDWGTDSPTNGTSPLYGIPYNIVHVQQHRQDKRHHR